MWMHSRHWLRLIQHHRPRRVQQVADGSQAAPHQTVGDDFRDGKITLPVVLAFRSADEEARGFWRRTMEDLEQKKGDLKRAVQLLESTGALQATVKRARHYGRLATEALKIFPDSEHKLALSKTVEFAVNRSY